MNNRRPFPWRKLTPAQIALLERLLSANGALEYGKLDYSELAAFEELRKLKLADMRIRGRSKLEAVATDQGRKARDNSYETDRIVVRVTDPQIELLRYLDDGFLYEDSVGRTGHDMPGHMRDVCRRMYLRGWVEWHGGWDGVRWARSTPAGREVLAAIDAFDDAICPLKLLD